MTCASRLVDSTWGKCVIHLKVQTLHFMGLESLGFEGRETHSTNSGELGVHKQQWYQPLSGGGAEVG